MYQAVFVKIKSPFLFSCHSWPGRMVTRLPPLLPGAPD